MEKISNQEFKFVSELLWGGVPVEKDWATETPIFKQESIKILKKYPLLEKSWRHEYYFNKWKLERLKTLKENGIFNFHTRVN